MRPLALLLLARREVRREVAAGAQPGEHGRGLQRPSRLILGGVREALAAPSRGVLQFGSPRKPNPPEHALVDGHHQVLGGHGAKVATEKVNILFPFKGNLI